VVRTAYAAATQLAQTAAHLAPAGDGKLARTLRARRGVIDRVRARATAVRDAARPLVWMHAPSVGEGLQARPVVEALRAAHPSWQFAYTFFSPSAERFAQSVRADITDYLPFDRAADADAMLDILRPSVVVFSKLDVWPVLVERASARGIPVAMISATLSAGSGRRGWWSRQVLRDAYASLDRVGAIDEPNAQRLTQLGVRATALTVTGDTRFDQVWAKAQSVDRTSTGLSRLVADATVRTVVAGSTWPADEAALFAAWGRRDAIGQISGGAVHVTPDAASSDAAANAAGGATRSAPARRLIIAPHEPTPAHLEPIEQWARNAGWTLHRLSTVEAGTPCRDADIILVDRIGILGELYALADVAFVGGGFHSAGLHSVIEPAAFGVPVLFGPQYHMSREAGLLLDAEAAHAVANADDLRRRLHAWLSDAATRTQAGGSARTLVQHELGATARSVALIEQLIAR